MRTPTRIAADGWSRARPFAALVLLGAVLLGQAGLEPARGLGSQALDSGLQTLELAKLHEQMLVTEVLPGCPAGWVR